MSSVDLSLPIFQIIDGIHASLREGKNLVLQAEPGAGKSTVVPLQLMDADWLEGKRVLMLEPRRMAAKSIAHYLARQRGEKVGESVGYRIRNDHRVSAATRLEIITEGILTRMIQSDPELADVGLLIFDEFHERSIHADIGLLLAREIQQGLREDLRLLVMSATLDAEKVATYIDNAGTLFCEGRAYPVEITYQGESRDYLDVQVKSAVAKALSQDEGDVLVFLPGMREIQRSMETCQSSLDQDDLVWLPLHGSLPVAQQEIALVPDVQGRRKVIFSTNIAETSLTIAGIKTVIDAGQERALTFNPGSGMTKLVTKRISKASAEQRAGRAGRVSAGHCIRLWSTTVQQSLEAYQVEEILQADLSDVVLDLARWGYADMAKVDWLTAPPSAHLLAAKDLLTSLGLITPKGQVTPAGHAASQLPVSPRLASMMLSANNDMQRQAACKLAAMLGERDLLLERGNADLTQRYHLLEQPISQLKQYGQGVRLQAVAAVKDSAANLHKKIKQGAGNLPDKLPSNLTFADEVVPALLLKAFPERLAKRRGKDSVRYQMANGKGVRLDDTDALQQHEWLVVTDCDLREGEGQIFAAAPVSVSVIEDVFAGRLEMHEQPSLDDKSGRFSCEQSLRYGPLMVANLGKGELSEAFIHKAVMEALKSKGTALLNWSEACESWLKRAVWLSSVNEEFGKITRESLLERADEWLLPYIGTVSRLSDLKKVDVLPLMQATLSFEHQQMLEAQAPTHYLAPSGKKVRIDYDGAQGPKVSIVLQEVFGEQQSPLLANAVNLRFELLSPAKRPIQITSDLHHFWRTSYFDVAKDMRSRYPKHRWPEEPLKEQPGRSIKRRQT